MKKKIMRGKNKTNQGEWAIHYIFKKLWKKMEKKLRWTTLALHPKKVMKEGKIFNPPSTLIHPQDTKKKKKPHIRSLKYMVGQCGKCGLSTHRIPFIHINSIYAWMAIKGYTMCDEHQSTFNCVIYQFP
jgi:hypothetical protein